MVWEVIWSEKSARQLAKIGRKDARIIRDRVLEIRENPFSAVIRLAGSPLFRLRVGEYRIIIDLRQNKMIIFVIQVDHRKRVYKKYQR